MKTILLISSIACLAANVAPPALFLAGRIDLAAAKTAMTWTSIAWFVVAGILIYGFDRRPVRDEPEPVTVP